MARFGWAVLLLAIVACGEKKPKDPVAAKVADAIPQLEKSTGLTFKTPPKFEARTKEEVRAFLQQRLRGVEAAGGKAKGPSGDKGGAR